MSSPSTSRSSPGTTRTLALLQAALLVLGLGVLCLRVLPHAWRTMNTDFPNDYVAARLVREGYTVDRIYEWEWFEEQRQRMTIEQPTAGFIPHTPFSVVPMLPFTWLPPLPAKRAWIISSLVLLAASIAVIAWLSKVRWLWIACAALLSLPLYRNLEYGQYYVLLLAVLSAALWCNQREHRFTAGLLTAFAAGLKIFPAVLLLFYLRKRDYRALAGFVIGAIVVVVASLACFGTTACERFVNEILPAALHGEAMDPFALPANSISALLHNLFVFDPQRNPHPLLHAPSLVGVLGPILQILVLAPIVLACSRQRNAERDSLEWCALLTAALTVSTLPASYNFIVLLLPCAVLFGFLQQEGRDRAAFLCAILYFLIGWLISLFPAAQGAMAFAGVPRLWLLVALTALFYLALTRRGAPRLRHETRWIAALALLTIVSIVSLVRHERGLNDPNHFIVTTGPQVFVVASPHAQSNGIVFHAMTLNGWQWAELDDHHPITLTAPPSNPSAWLVESKGQHSLWLRDPSSQSSIQISGSDLDVYDFSAKPPAALVFSAMDRAHSVQLYRVEDNLPPQPLHITNARFPAISPDQQWLAYSSLQHGTWRLMVRDLASGIDHPLHSADCNDSYPVWSPDSKSLTYVSDCGRGLGQTAFAAITLRHSADFPSSCHTHPVRPSQTPRRGLLYRAHVGHSQSYTLLSGPRGPSCPSWFKILVLSLCF